MRVFRYVLVLLGAVISAFVLGKGFSWNTARKAKAEVLDEIKNSADAEYDTKKAAINARDRITDIDAAREFLRDRSN